MSKSQYYSNINPQKLNIVPFLCDDMMLINVIKLIQFAITNIVKIIKIWIFTNLLR